MAGSLYIDENKKQLRAMSAAMNVREQMTLAILCEFIRAGRQAEFIESLEYKARVSADKLLDELYPTKE